MRHTLLFTLVALFLTVGTANAQDAIATPSLFSREALSRALPPDTAAAGTQLDPRTNWARVRELRPSTEILLSVRGASTKRCGLLSVDDSSLTVVNLEAAGQPALRVPRDEVMQVARLAGRKGSVAATAIGAGGGFLLGFLSASALAYKDCGGGCGDEQLLMGVSLVGMPIGGAVLGYTLAGGGRDLRTIYLRP